MLYICSVIHSSRVYYKNFGIFIIQLNTFLSCGYFQVLVTRVWFWQSRLAGQNHKVG